MDSLIDLVLAQAAAAPYSVALSQDSGSLTYGELTDQIDGVADALTSFGIGPGDRVCTVLPDGPDTGLVMLAVASVAVCCPLNPATTEAECHALFTRILPAAVLLQPGVSAGARRACAALNVPVVEVLPRKSLTDGPLRLRQSGARSSRPASGVGESLLLLTSGSTGRSKLVPLTARQIVAAATATCRAYGLGPDDRRLNIMPMFHVQGFVGSLIASLCCGSSVLCASDFSPVAVPELIERERITWFSASPTMHRRIVDSRGARFLEHRLRFVRCGSGALQPTLREELAEFYGVPVVESYGMTEAHQIASTPLSSTDDRAGLVPTGSEIAILGADGVINDSPRRLGEIVIAGPNVIDRYADLDRAGDPSFVGPWFRTGDQGEIAENGTLRITGRFKELINRGGEKVSPREVEDVLLRHESVREAAVYAAAHDDLVEEVAAAVVLERGSAVAAHELRDYVAARLAQHKVPRYITFLDALPATGNGKPSRKLLQEAHAAAPPSPVTAPSLGSSPPRSPLETVLVGIWSKALGGRPIGIHDDFFALDGESLAATALLAVVREAFGVEITHLAFADRAATVASMAEFITVRAVVGAPSPALPSRK